MHEIYKDESEFAGHWNMTWTRDWAINKDKTPWDLENVFGTVEYAARRILALLPRRDGDPDATTRTIVARMSHATRRLHDTHDRYRNRTESSGPTKLETLERLEGNLLAIQQESRDVASRGHDVFGPELEREWSGAFQQYQNIIVVALRHVGDKIVEAHETSFPFHLIPYS